MLYSENNIPIDCIIISIESNRPINYPLIPLESGTTIVDTYVIQPREINITIQCTPDVLLSLQEQIYAGKSFSIDTRTTFYDNLYANSIPEVNDDSIYGDLHVPISFIQVMHSTTFVAGKVMGSAKGKANQATARTGNATPQPPKSAINDLARGVSDWFG